MARLLTLALAETTSDEEGYQVVAWNYDEKRWVTLQVSMNEFLRNGQPVWDIFAFTEAEVRSKNQRRVEECRLVGSSPRLVQHVESWDERKKWLDYLTDQSGVRSIHDQGRCIGIVRPHGVYGFRIKPNLRRQQYDGIPAARTIAWQAYIPFHDGQELHESLCKDMRWKEYWVDVANNRPDRMAALEATWLEYTQAHPLYFLVRMWDWNGRTGPFGTSRFWAISGVHCLPLPQDRLYGNVVPF